MIYHKEYLMKRYLKYLIKSNNWFNLNNNGPNLIDKYDVDIKEMLYEALNINKVIQPIISILSNACTHFEENKINKACLKRYEHNYCNENDIFSS